MKNSTHFDFTHQLGIDIAKATLDCWLRPAGAYRQVTNNPDGFNRLIKWLRAAGAKPVDTIICMENTGVYGKRLLVALTGAGWPCAVEKTTILEKVSPEHHRKDDAFDARLLAEYADRFSDRLHLSTPPEQALETIGQLYSERRRLVRQQTATKTKRRQAVHQPHCPQLIGQGWAEQLELFERQIQAIEARIQQIVNNHAGLSAYFQLLESIPGIGQVTAWLWLILFYGQAKLDPKKIASRFGLAPHSHTSGSSVRGKTRSSGHGASEMRGNMAMAAQSASTHYKRFKDYKQRKLAEGKPWPLVRNNLANKLIAISCAIWNSGQLYDPKHVARFDRQKNAA